MLQTGTVFFDLIHDQLFVTLFESCLECDRKCSESIALNALAFEYPFPSTNYMFLKQWLQIVLKHKILLLSDGHVTHGEVRVRLSVVRVG